QRRTVCPYASARIDASQRGSLRSVSVVTLRQKALLSGIDTIVRWYVFPRVERFLKVRMRRGTSWSPSLSSEWSLSPDFRRCVDNQAKLGHLLFRRERVALKRRGKSALRA